MSANSSIESRDYFPTVSSNVNPSDSSFANLTPESSSFMDIPRGLEEEELPNGDIKKNEPEKLKRSTANSYNAVRLKTIDGKNYPQTDEETQNFGFFDKVTARQLVENPRGASIFNVHDFAYLSKYGILPNNRLITLRRFAFPAFDDIFRESTKAHPTEPDIARMLTYSDQEVNKLSDILTFTCGVKWKQLKSSTESASTIGTQNGVSGFMGGALKLLDPSFGTQALQGENRLKYDPLHDQNRVHGPVDSIDEMHIREIGLLFDQQFVLTFEYDLQSIDGRNQKAVFMDILANILLMTTNDAKFWGGARFWVGARPSKYMNNLKFMAPDTFEEFLQGATTQFKSFVGKFSGPGGAQNAKDTLRQIATNAFNLGFGKLLDKIGRPSIPTMQSLLTGNPSGEWHLTVGNPLNPVLSAGDLVLTTSTVTFNDELGFDDFPTKIKCEMTLTHNKPRGRAEIESMFNCGKGRIYFKPKDILRNSTNSKEIINLPDMQTSGIDKSLFGSYSIADIERNASAVWSFLKK